MVKARRTKQVESSFVRPVAKLHGVNLVPIIFTSKKLVSERRVRQVERREKLSCLDCVFCEAGSYSKDLVNDCETDLVVQRRKEVFRPNLRLEIYFR